MPYDVSPLPSFDELPDSVKSAIVDGLTGVHILRSQDDMMHAQSLELCVRDGMYVIRANLYPQYIEIPATQQAAIEYLRQSHTAASNNTSRKTKTHKSTKKATTRKATTQKATTRKATTQKATTRKVI